MMNHQPLRVSQKASYRRGVAMRWALMLVAVALLAAPSAGVGAPLVNRPQCAQRHASWKGVRHRHYRFRRRCAAAAHGARVVGRVVPAPVPAVPRQPAWRGDLTGGTWAQYDGSPIFHPDGNPLDYSLVTSPVPPGFSYAFKATVQSGTNSVVSGQYGDRTLLSLWPNLDPRKGKTRAYEGADTWYRDEVYFPAGFQPTRNTGWNWLLVLHNFPNGPCCGNLSVAVVTDRSDGGPAGQARLSTRIMGGGSPQYPIDGGTQTGYSNPAAQIHWIKGPSIQTGHWYDLVWHVHWDWRPTGAGGTGFAQYWIDGTLMGSWRGPTLYYYAALGGPGQACLQDGYYRPTDDIAGYSQPTVSVYHAGTMIGPTPASIGEIVHAARRISKKSHQSWRPPRRRAQTAAAEEQAP